MKALAEVQQTAAAANAARAHAMRIALATNRHQCRMCTCLTCTVRQRVRTWRQPLCTHLRCRGRRTAGLGDTADLLLTTRLRRSCASSCNRSCSAAVAQAQAQAQEQRHICVVAADALIRCSEVCCGVAYCRATMVSATGKPARCQMRSSARHCCTNHTNAESERVDGGQKPFGNHNVNLTPECNAALGHQH